MTQTSSDSLKQLQEAMLAAGCVYRIPRVIPVCAALLDDSHLFSVVMVRSRPCLLPYGVVKIYKGCKTKAHMFTQVYADSFITF